MKDIDRIRKLFDIMDDMFEEGFHSSISIEEIQKIEGKPVRKNINVDGLDIFQDKDNIYVTVDLRGVRDDEIGVSADDDELFISMFIDGNKYKRNFYLPASVESEDIDYTFDNFVLDITLRKKVKDDDGRSNREIEGTGIQKSKPE